MISFASKSLTILLSLASFASLAADNQPAFTQKPEKILNGLRCVYEVQNTLKSWQVMNDWGKGLGDTEQQVYLYSPTQAFAKWVTVKSDAGEPTLYLDSEVIRTRITYDSACRQKSTIVPVRFPASFSNYAKDGELRNVISKNKSGIVASWSPNMPWSVVTMPKLEAAAKQLGIPLTVYLSPEADMKEAKKVAKENKFPNEWLKPHASLELAMRGLTRHEPSLITYKAGHLARAARPGHEETDQFVAYLKEVFNEK